MKRDDDPIVEEWTTYNEFVAVARERSSETVELFKIFQAGRDFEKGDLVHYRPGTKIVRFFLWSSYVDWRRLNDALKLGWGLEAISSPEDLIINPSYFKKAAKIQFESWLLSEEIAMQARHESARSLLSEISDGTRKRIERRFVNRAAWIYEKELKMIGRASLGEWK